MMTTLQIGMPGDQNGAAALLKAASESTCICHGLKANSLVVAAENGCLRCCYVFIKEAEEIAAGAAVLDTGMKNNHIDVVQLLLSLNKRLEQNPKNIVQMAAKHGKAMLDEVLKLILPKSYNLLQEMRGLPCICMSPTNNVREALEKRCMSCCGAWAHEAPNAVDFITSDVQFVDNRHLASVKIMSTLQQGLGGGTGSTELIFAVANNLYEVAVLLVDEQRDIADANDTRASEFAASVNNPDIWALFPTDIPPEYAADLTAAYSADCSCGGESESLAGAMDWNCIRCCARFIWQAGPSFSRRDTELMFAVQYSSPVFVRLLRHSQGGLQNRLGQSALMLAVQARNLEALELLIQKEARLRDHAGKTALMAAAAAGDVAYLPLLARFEAKMQDGDGKTALVHAVLHGRSEAAKQLLLLEKDIPDHKGRAAEDYAFQLRNKAIQRIFGPRTTQQEYTGCLCGKQVKNLVGAAQNGCLQCCVKFKRQVGMLVGGQTALMAAARAGNPDIVALLLKEEACMQNEAKQTALMLAVANRQLDAVKLLLPAESDIRDAKNASVCTYAARSGDEAILEHVLKKTYPGAYQYLQEARKAQCICGGQSGDLEDAAKNGCLKCTASFICETGDRSHAIALGHAASQGDVSLIRLLLPFAAGMKGEHDTVALVKAVQSLQRESFEILRRNDVECAASGIPFFMFAVYEGDFQTALQHHKEFGSVFQPTLNVLDFALLGGRRACIKALIGDAKSREQLAGTAAWSEIGENCLASRILSSSDNQHLFSQILEVVCAASQEIRSTLVSGALFRYSGDAARLLRPFCSPMRAQLLEAMQLSEDEASVIRGLWAMKNVGPVQDMDDVVFEELRYFGGDPLKQQQLELAQYQLKMTLQHYEEEEATEEIENSSYLSDHKNFGWRETEADSSFNRALLLECRLVVSTGSPALRSSPISPAISRRASKLARNAVVIHGAYIYACTKLKEMLDE